LFKRRKEETPATPPAKSQSSGGAGQIFPSKPAGTSAAPNSSPSQTAKDQADMGRTPFPTPPSSNAAPGAVPGRPAAAPGAASTAAAPGGTPRRDVPERRTLVVGRGISVQGTVQDAERLVVEGTVEASKISATELVVSAGGVFRGEVEVEDAELAGTVDGSLIVRGSLTIRASGRLLGKTRCRRLQVEDGGQITGHLEMITDGSSSRPVGEPIAATRPAPVQPSTAETATS